MKNKILYQEITAAVESIAAALRKNSSAPLYCNISILSRDHSQDAEETPDLYAIRVHETSEEVPVDNMILTESGFIYRGDDGKIVRVERQTCGGVEDDTTC